MMLDEFRIDTITLTTKHVINSMLEEGFLLHSIAAAVGADHGALAEYMDRHAGAFGKSYRIGYDWRAAHSMLEWPDYVLNNELVGRKSIYWEKIPWHNLVRTDTEPQFLFENEVAGSRVHFMSYGSNIN